MTGIIKKALTRRIATKTGLNESIEPDERLLLGVKFAIAITFCLFALEIANLAIFRHMGQ